LEALYRIQELDTRLYELRDREENHHLKAELADMQEKENERRGEYEAASSSLEESRSGQKRMEDELQRAEEKIKREEGKLYGGTVTNPKELRGLQAEISSLKRQKDNLEMELLEDMERLDEIKATADELQSILGNLEADLTEKKNTLNNELSGIQAEMKGLEEEKEKLREDIDEELLELYDKLLESKHQVAVVKVVDGVCTGCRVELPGKEYDRFLKSDDIFRCSSCRRILIK
jgi:predicted  nucleic acid-binding Zn-ribbon protein